MKKHSKIFSFIFAAFVAFSLSSCQTTSEPDTNTGSSAGSQGTNMDNSENSRTPNTSSATDNTDTNSRGNQLYKPGPIKDNYDVDYTDDKTTREFNENTKNNGVREPNEYSSGRSGGQYNNPNATTTKSGVNAEQSPGTGSPSHTGSSGK